MMKSAYCIAKELVELGKVEESSLNHQDSPCWKKFWQLNDPLKVKIFKFRVCMDGLPTMLNI